MAGRTARAYVGFDNDDRYPWVHVELNEGQSPTFAIIIGYKSYGFDFNDGVMTPICLCSAHEKSECICETGWGDDE